MKMPEPLVCLLKSGPPWGMAFGHMEDCSMPMKRHTSEEIVAKLRQVEALTAQGGPVAEAIRSIGVTEVTLYRWHTEYGGLKGDQVKRLYELEAENAGCGERCRT